MRLNLNSFGGASRALANREYRFYVSGHVVHVLGWWGNKIGLGWLAWELTRSASWLGIIAFASLMPVMIIGPFAGALADRYGHRRVALRAGFGGFLSTLTIAVIALSGAMTVPLLVVLTLIQGLCFGIDFPARQALIPQLVDRGSISAAVALNSTVFYTGGFLGPIIAGYLIESVGSGASILLAACTSAWMLTMISLIRPDPARSAPAKKQSILSDLLDGFRYTWQSRTLVYLIGLPFIGGLLIRPFQDLLPGFAATVFNQGAEGLAMLNTAAGLGALMCATLMVLRGRTEGMTRLMLIGAAGAGVMLLLFTLTSSYMLGIGLIFLVALFLLAMQVSATSLLQTIAHPEMRGRAVSLNSSLSVGGPAVGGLLCGILADGFGLQLVLGIAGGTAVVLYLLISPALLRRRQNMERDPHKQVDVAPAN